MSRVATTRPYPFSSPRSPVPLHVQYGTPLVDMINHFPLYPIISLVFPRHGRQKINTTCQLHCNISYGPRKSCWVRHNRRPEARIHHASLSAHRVCPPEGLPQRGCIHFAMSRVLERVPSPMSFHPPARSRAYAPLPNAICRLPVFLSFPRV